MRIKTLNLALLVACPLEAPPTSMTKLQSWLFFKNQASSVTIDAAVIYMYVLLHISFSGLSSLADDGLPCTMSVGGGTKNGNQL
jgi:hypothetical protein